MEVANPYHPIFDSVDFTEFQGFDAYSTVAEAIVNTKSALIPEMMNFQTFVTVIQRMEVTSKD